MTIFNTKEAMRTGVFVCGTSGSGKTVLGFWLAKWLMDAGVTVYVIDPSQAWSKSPIHTRIKYDTMPKLVKWNDPVSTVFDVSLLNWQERMKITDTICKVLLTDRKTTGDHPSTFIFFEEGQFYFYQGSMRTPRATPNAVELVTNGRNFNLRYGVITQFASMIDKVLVKMTKQRYAGWSNETNDIKYLKSILGTYRTADSKKPKHWADKLAELGVGDFVYSYPVRGQPTRQIHVENWFTREEQKKPDLNRFHENLTTNYTITEMPTVTVTVG